MVSAPLQAIKLKLLQNESQSNNLFKNHELTWNTSLLSIKAPKSLWGTRKVRFSSYSLPHDRQTDEVNLNLLKKHIWWTHLCQWNRATFQRIHNHKSSKHQLEACKFKTGWIHFKHFLRYYLFITIQFSRYSNGGFHFYIQYVTF